MKALGILAGLLAAAPVLTPAGLAQSAPRTRPSRDVVVIYAVQGQALSLLPGGIAGPVTLSWDAAGQRLRAEAQGRSQVALIDMRAAAGQAYDTALRITMPLPIRANDLQPLTLDGARLAARGKDRVAGLSCTLYAVEGSAPGTLCLTADGVPLRGEGSIRGKPGRFTATSVRYGRLPESLFTVPPGTMALDAKGAGGLAGLVERLGGAGGLRSLLGQVR